MKKIIKNKISIAILTMLVISIAFTGCKIENPNDVAREILNGAYSASSQAIVDQEKSDEVAKNKENKKNKDSSKNELISESSEKQEEKENNTSSIQQQQQSSSSSQSQKENILTVNDVKGNSDKINDSKYNITTTSNTTSSNSQSSSQQQSNQNQGNQNSSSGTSSKWDHYDDKDWNINDFVDKDGDGRDDITGLDKFLTDPIPEGKPHPVEPENVNINTNKVYYCTLSIRCDTILKNIKDLDKELLYLTENNRKDIPYQQGVSDGVIYEEREVYFYEGESVFDVLLRETKAERIQMEFSFTPMYNSHYIEGIDNFYEFSCGELSGWMYKVNGWFPNYGCSRYLLKDGDVINWEYTCDLGRDVGCEWLGDT
ncbi:MAG: DUF4430 domain-containing protein [Oscillospiraceae bacterium]